MAEHGDAKLTDLLCRSPTAPRRARPVSTTLRLESLRRYCALDEALAANGSLDHSQYSVTHSQASPQNVR
jgi:hypothetical protein